MQSIARTVKEFVSLKTPENELEIRFSTVVRKNTFFENAAANDKRTGTYKFIPVIDKRDFYRVLLQFETIDSLEQVMTNSTDVFFFGNKIRKTMYESGRIDWEKKNKFKFFDIFALNVRVALAEEIEIAGPPPVGLQIETIRKKCRRSFTDHNRNIRYDFTKVITERNGTVKETFEVEMELLNGVSVESAMFGIGFLLQNLQQSSLLLPIYESHNSLLEYKVLTRLNSPFFVGAQPECLHKREEISPETHCITEKYDGERLLVFISDNSTLYFYSRNMRPRVYGFQNFLHRGSIVDCELFGNTLFFFDILFYKGNDLRGLEDYPLKKRLNLIEAIVKDTQGTKNSLQIQVKKFGFTETDWQATLTRYLENSQGKDGFIFTPIHEPYSLKQKWTTLYKWKPLEMSTVDFLVKIDPNDPCLWNLFVGGETCDVPCSFLPQVRIPIESSGYFSQFDGFVIEAALAPKFSPLKVRYDKTKPNFRTVAEDTWKYVKNPVNLADLSNPRKWESMRRSHNMLKSRLIESTFEEVIDIEFDEDGTGTIDWVDMEEPEFRVLDLACGRGGDLGKWKKYCHSTRNNAFYLGIDCDDNLLLEAKNRAIQYSDQRFKTNFFKMDLSSESFVAHRREAFHVVSCQFALHYFYSNKSFDIFMKTVLMNLKIGGYFICTLFDGLSVYNFIRRSMENADFTIKPVNWNSRTPLGQLKSKDKGNEISVCLNHDSTVILKQETVENLVFCDNFVKTLQTMGLVLIEMKKFEDKSLKDHEKIYSDLHQSYIFVKTELTDNCPWIPVESTEFQNNSLRFKRKISKSQVTFFLDLITGKEFDATKAWDFDELTGFYSIFISVSGKIYSPPLFLNESTIVYFSVINDDEYYLFANENKIIAQTHEVILPGSDVVEVILPGSDVVIEREVHLKLDDVQRRPLTGKGCWTVKDLTEAINSLHLQMYPSKKKKQELYDFLVESLTL